jgi:hypothetical protein
MKKFRSRAPAWLAASGLLLFAASLFLPALRVFVLGGPAEFTGWQANAWAIGFGYTVIAPSGNVGIEDNRNFMLLGVVGLLNLVLVLGPFIILKNIPNKSLLRILASISILGLVLGSVAPLTLTKIHVSPLIGYFSWLFSYILLISAIRSAMRK